MKTTYEQAVTAFTALVLMEDAVARHPKRQSMQQHYYRNLMNLAYFLRRSRPRKEESKGMKERLAFFEEEVGIPLTEALDRLMQEPDSDWFTGVISDIVLSFCRKWLERSRSRSSK